MTDESTIDFAWSRVEAALPEGWEITLVWGTISPGERWAAAAGPWPGAGIGAGVYAGADTPAAALRALAEKLEAMAE